MAHQILGFHDVHKGPTMDDGGSARAIAWVRRFLCRDQMPFDRNPGKFKHAIHTDRHHPSINRQDDRKVRTGGHLGIRVGVDPGWKVDQRHMQTAEVDAAETGPAAIEHRQEGTDPCHLCQARGGKSQDHLATLEQAKDRR
jgi:hypothetical protein